MFYSQCIPPNVFIHVLSQRNLAIRPVQRLILPRPIVQQQQPIQFWRIPEGVGAFPLPQVFVPRLAISQFNLSPIQFQPQITAVPLGTLTQSFPKIKGRDESFSQVEISFY